MLETFVFNKNDILLYSKYEMRKVSCLENKSEILFCSAEMLHDKSSYVGVAHASYYSCYQLLKHIWLCPMGKTEAELDSNCSQTKMGSHEYLLNQIVKHIDSSGKKTSKEDARQLRNDLPQLKRLRTNADYADENFDSTKSGKAITLSKKILPILKRYCK